MKYHVKYIIGCSPKIKSFNTKADLEKFVKGFIKKHGGLDDRYDNWIELVFKGKLLNINTVYTVN